MKPNRFFVSRSLFCLTLALLLWASPAWAWSGVVYKSPTCGCCTGWLEHMQQAGVDLKVMHQDDLSPTKDQLGVPQELRSCHTAVIDGLVVEGHVPVQDVLKLLKQAHQGKGLAVPGMPVGSPGMEMGPRKDAFEVILFDQKGKQEVYSRHP